MSTLLEEPRMVSPWLRVLLTGLLLAFVGSAVVVSILNRDTSSEPKIVGRVEKESKPLTPQEKQDLKEQIKKVLSLREGDIFRSRGGHLYKVVKVWASNDSKDSGRELVVMTVDGKTYWPDMDAYVQLDHPPALVVGRELKEYLSVSEIFPKNSEKWTELHKKFPP